MMTPDMIAETWLGATGVRTGQPNVQGHDAGFQSRNRRATRTKIAVATPGVSASVPSGASVNEPLAARSKAKSANRHSVAVWVATR